MITPGLEVVTGSGPVVISQVWYKTTWKKVRDFYVHWLFSLKAQSLFLPTVKLKKIKIKGQKDLGNLWLRKREGEYSSPCGKYRKRVAPHITTPCKQFSADRVPQPEVRKVGKGTWEYENIIRGTSSAMIQGFNFNILASVQSTGLDSSSFGTGFFSH